MLSILQGIYRVKISMKLIESSEIIPVEGEAYWALYDDWA
jgi:hypothetical protein